MNDATHSSFQCPSCGASLSYEGGSKPNVTCQFCGSDVIVPEELRTQATPPSAPFAPALDLSGLSLDKLAELKRLARSGQKIEAIKLYREMFDVGLKEAKDAVEKLEAGQPLVVTSVSVTSAGASVDQATRLAEVVQLLRAGQKIEAIKLYREIFGVGLKEAKDAVEAMEAGLGADLTQLAASRPRPGAASQPAVSRPESVSSWRSASSALCWRWCSACPSDCPARTGKRWTLPAPIPPSSNPSASRSKPVGGPSSENCRAAVRAAPTMKFASTARGRVAASRSGPTRKVRPCSKKGPGFWTQRCFWTTARRSS